MSGHPARMARERRSTIHDGRVVDLCVSRSRRRREGKVRSTRPPSKRGGSQWKAVALLALLAFAAVGGRERLDPLGLREWFAGGALHIPIRAAMNISPRRADCRIVRVIDGDTVDVDCAGEGLLRTRLVGFDTPEVFSPGCPSELALGTQATRALERKIRLSGDMRIDFRGSDRYGRRLARLSLDGRDVAQPMIAEGLARPYDGGRRRSWCG